MIMSTSVLIAWARLALIAVSLLGVTSAIWIEPSIKARLEVRANASGTQHAGAVVRYGCTAYELLDTNTLSWNHVKAGVEFGMGVRGRSELVLERAAETSDANTALLCTTAYFSLEEGAPEEETWRLQTYYLTSDPIQLVVASGIPTTPAPSIASQTVTMTANATASALRAGDVVQFTCATNNMQYVAVDVRIAKGNIELKLHEGWQPTRVLTYAVAAADSGAAVYCKAWLADAGNSYAVNSNRLRLTVQP